MLEILNLSTSNVFQRFPHLPGLSPENVAEIVHPSKGERITPCVIQRDVIQHIASRQDRKAGISRQKIKVEESETKEDHARRGKKIKGQKQITKDLNFPLSYFLLFIPVSI